MSTDTVINHTLVQTLVSGHVLTSLPVSIRLVETHISWVLLTGQYAYKIKKPVRFGFLDFSSLEKRHFYCTEEIRLNRRLAPNIYLDVVPITGTPAHPAVGGNGTAIEYAVKMTQFTDGQLLSERAENGLLSVEEIDQIAVLLAEFHEIVERAGSDSLYGDALDIKHWFDENFDQIAPLLEDERDQQQLEKIRRWGESEWTNKSELMQFRKQQGYVRECHGDLHLSNITLVDGKVTLFDCIEFNPALRWIDLISEVAFLMIDLFYYGYDRHAFRFLNRYLQVTGDYRSLDVIHYYLVYRALVLAKVSLLRRQQQCHGNDKQEAQKRFQTFMSLAERFTRKNQAVMMITHGYSGSGKSFYAERCAETIGAIHIRSDAERKRLFGYQLSDATDSEIGGGIYTQDANVKTYRHLADAADSILHAGFSVITDATFLKTWQRDIFRQAAHALALPFYILDLNAADETRESRIRQRINDASEATVDVMREQQQSAQPLSQAELACTITIYTERDSAFDTWLASLVDCNVG
ncbi:MAG: AAA family ATPase [Methylococcaceae bacterium]|nr:AAA family ATPase [Methylococcaceae bacterium]